VSQLSGRAELLKRHERRLTLMVPAESSLLRGLRLFAGVPERARDKVIEKARRYLHVVDVEPGETILREGDYSDSAYYIIRGSVEIDLSKLASAASGGVRSPHVRGGAHAGPMPDAGPRQAAQAMLGRGVNAGSATLVLSAAPVPVAPDETVKKLGSDEIFGEISALSRYPVSATVRAESDVRLLRVRLPGLRMLTASSPEFKAFLDTRYRERSLAQHLSHVGLFADVEPAFVDHLRDRADLVSFEPGQVIVEEGAGADAFYLVRGGFVKVSVKAGTSDLAVTYLRKGDYAGEAALLLDHAWPFTLQALDHVELVKIAKADFEELVERYPAIQDALWAEGLGRLKARGAAARDPTASEYMQMAMETGLIHGESVLLIDLSTCTRCDDCVRGCADAHGGQPVFVREGQKYRNWLVPTACYQCTDPVCMMDCPTGAITRDMGTLEVTINSGTCIGCGNCAERCPWGNIVMVDSDEHRSDAKPVAIAAKCDLCVARPEGPACVQMCPHGAAVRISFKDMERVTATLK
jgi:CRP-like cAMP-binding protein/Fe-S-cluster-containing hydrogenase component 2